MEKVWINGRLFDKDKAKVSVFDRGFLYGDGVFETMRAYSGVIFGLEKHTERLHRSLRTIRLKMPYKDRELIRALERILTVNALKDAYVRITVSRGAQRSGIAVRAGHKPTVVLVAEALSPYQPKMYERGLSLATVPARNNEYSPIITVKSLNYLVNILARMEANERGFDDAILLNTNDFISEATTANIFLVKRGAIATPSLKNGVLPGITRGYVLKIAKRLGIRTLERNIRREELEDAHEAFLTNSLCEILPVRRVDNIKIGNGMPGRITKLLHYSYRALVRDEVCRSHRTKIHC